MKLKSGNCSKGVVRIAFIQQLHIALEYFVIGKSEAHVRMKQNVVLNLSEAAGAGREVNGKIVEC